MYFILIRRFIKWNFKQNGSTNREKPPLKFNDCISEPPKLRRKYIVSPWFVLILIGATLYYHMFYNSNMITEKITADNARERQDVKTDAMIPYDEDSRKNISTTVKKLLLKDVDFYLPLPFCMSNKTGQDGVTFTPKIPKSQEPQYEEVKMGGYYSPKDCRSRHKVALLVPYRDRPSNLAIFMFNIHPFLMKQNLEYRIFVIEQHGKDKFNKGRLYNAGFKEMQKYGKWQCVVFHDLDLIPLNDRIKYTCPIFPRHMCGTIEEKKKIHENSLFGGVTAMSLSHYRIVNGYSNNYWGWGGEDHDMFWRIQFARLPIVRYNKSIAIYAHITHSRATANPNRYQILGGNQHKYKVEGGFKKEGLSTVEYEVIYVKLRRLYTHIVVDINPKMKPVRY